MNIPIAITAARIGLVPVFLLLAYTPSDAAAVGAFVVFIVASLSDHLDGYLARRHGTVTRAGKFLDPLADKLLIGAALVVLVDARLFPLWAALVIALREIAVSLLRIQIVRGGGDLPASSAAKTKTVLQISMVSWWLLPWGALNPGHHILMWTTLGVTAWSGIEYFAKAQRVEEVAP